MARMKHTYHLVTPFSRPENFKALSDHLRPLGITWHLLLDDPRKFELELEPWIREHHYQRPERDTMPWRFMVNRFARALDNNSDHLYDGDRFLLLSDDTFYEEGFFEKVDALDGDVIIVSAKRGDQIPPGTTAERMHDTNTLVAVPENMVPCQVDSQQIVMSGHIFRRINLVHHHACDGFMIQQIVLDHDTVYAPDVFILFNYLESGRWNPPPLS